MSDWQTYVDDPRTICKYGTKCYQKNSDHLKTFKHPPIKRKFGNKNQPNKRFKPSPEQRDIKEANAHHSEKKDLDDQINDVSESKIIPIQIPEVINYHDQSSDLLLLKRIFLVEMPPDFLKFFECLSSENVAVEKVLDKVNLQLIGPYDLLLGKLPVLEDNDLYLIHWRFFYDPPEYQAVIKEKGQSEFHIGYYRDNPNEKPVFLASCNSSIGCNLTIISENIFGAVYAYLTDEKKHSPFIAMACKKLADKVKQWAETNNYSINKFDIKKRHQMCVTNTLHGAGIYVNYNKKTQLGYRPLVESDVKLRKIFKSIEEATTKQEKDKIISDLQPVITYASIAVDECDFGTGLEAGIALFCSGIKELEPSALSSLTAAYSLLNRDAFSKIIQTHLKYRRKGPSMSVLARRLSLG